VGEETYEWKDRWIFNELADESKDWWIEGRIYK
jgi:hypothetical protein